MRALRPIGQEERLSIVDHLDELRSRILVCGVFIAVIFGVCFWQNQPLVNALNRALPASSSTGLGAVPRQTAKLHHAFQAIEQGANEMSQGVAQLRGAPASLAQGLRELARGAAEGVRALPTHVAPREKPVTLGPGESFTVTLTVVGYFTLLISLPLLLYQLYAFVIPALSRDERRIAVPTMIAAPLLFVAGALFTYFEVLPPAIHFLQGYNSTQFQVLVQAKTLYKFEILLMLGIGLAFQVPLVLLGLQRLGVITSQTLTVNWRYAVVLIAVIAAALPGVDPVTMFFETIPLVLLYVASILMLKVVDHRKAKRQAAELADLGRVDGFDAT